LFRRSVMQDSRCDLHPASRNCDHGSVIQDRHRMRIESELLTLPATQGIPSGDQSGLTPRPGASWSGVVASDQSRRVPIGWRQDGAWLDRISQLAEPAAGAPRVSRRRRPGRDGPRAYGPGLLCAPGGDRCVLHRCPRVLQCHGSGLVGPDGASAAQHQAMMALRSERDRMALP
jgi:hypothetical protein